MFGFYSVDITIDDDGKPSLIEINGSNSGFDGFLIAYEDTSVQDAISAAFREFIGERDIYVVTQLVNTGELPASYLDKLIQDVMYFRSVENIHATLRKGVVGTTWARMRTDRPPSTIGAGTSLDALVEKDSRFKKVMLNVADPTYVIPAGCFKSEVEKGALWLRDDLKGTVEAHKLHEQDVLWLRCPSLAFTAPLPRCIEINSEFPYEAISDNKLFMYNVLLDRFADNLPLSIPVGNRTSSASAIADMLARSKSTMFIRKPLMGSQARGIELFRRQDIEEYAARIARLEQRDSQSSDGLPLDLRGVPDLLAAWALRFDVSLFSELTLSRPIHCRRTGRYHHGCMRTLVLLRQEGATVDVRFLGGYWRLAAIPVDGDGLLWERFIGSQSQGAFCEPVSADDMDIAQRFARNVLTDYCHKLAALPQSTQAYREWETRYWLERYRQHVPALQDDTLWSVFVAEMHAAASEAEQIKQRAAAAGYLQTPTAFLTTDQAARTRLPYLIKEPQRIVAR